jgi:hypothetical protein
VWCWSPAIESELERAQQERALNRELPHRPAAPHRDHIAPFDLAVFRGHVAGGKDVREKEHLLVGRAAARFVHRSRRVRCDLSVERISNSGDGWLLEHRGWNCRGLLAAVFGLIDWLAIPAGTRAKTIGLWHAASNVVAIAGFGFVCWVRYSSGQLAPTSGLFTLEVIALLFGAVGGWLGGELVDRLGVGVDTGANLDAPNSISGRRPSRVTYSVEDCARR